MQFSVGELTKLTLAVGFMAERVVGGAAQRRQERRLRLWLRHERLTVQVALAEDRHHAAPRGQKTAKNQGGVLRDDGERALRGSAGSQP